MGRGRYGAVGDERWGGGGVGGGGRGGSVCVGVGVGVGVGVCVQRSQTIRWRIAQCV